MRKRVAGHGIVDGGESATAVDEGVGTGGGVVGPDDLAQIVDAKCLGAVGGQGIVQGGVGGAAVGVVEEPVIDSVGGVVADDLPRAIDAKGRGAAGRRRIVEGGVCIAISAAEEAVHDQHGVQVNPHDLSRGV